MTLQQLIVIVCVYLTVLVVVIYFTRPKLRRIAGSLVGGVAGGSLLLLGLVLGNVYGLWRASFPSRPSALTLFCIGTAISCARIYLGTWRLVRRFGCRGLTAFLGLVALIGPPRDYLVAAKYPEWIVFTGGVVPIVADAATYVCVVAFGHAVMRLIAGLAQEDQLAQRP